MNFTCCHQVEYDLENSSHDNLRILSSDRVEQSGIAQCMMWYPPITKESFILTANDQVRQLEFITFSVHFVYLCIFFIHIYYIDVLLCTCVHFFIYISYIVVLLCTYVHFSHIFYIDVLLCTFVHFFISLCTLVYTYELFDNIMYFDELFCNFVYTFGSVTTLLLLYVLSHVLL